jgi:hypothetical protein
MRMTMFLSLLFWPKADENDNSTTEYMIQRKSDAGWTAPKHAKQEVHQHKYLKDY